MKDCVLVTGGAGFLGSHLVEKLVACGYKVRVLDDLSTGKINNLKNCLDSIEVIESSILDDSALAKAIESCKCVFHLAAVVSVQRSINEPIYAHEVNTLGTLKILLAAKEANSKIIFNSSAAVYGDAEVIPISEKFPNWPISPYGAQKFIGEHYVSQFHRFYGLRGISLRHFNIFGHRQELSNPYSGVINIFFHAAMCNQSIKIFGDGSQTRDFLYVSDAVNANILAMNSHIGDGRAINIGSGVSMSIKDLANKVNEVTGANAEIRFLKERSGDIKHSLADIKLAKIDLGFQPKYSPIEGLAKMWAERDRFLTEIG